MGECDTMGTSNFALSLFMALGAAFLLCFAPGCANVQEQDQAVSQPPLIEIPLITFQPGEGEEPLQGFFQEYRIAPGDVLDVLYQVNTWEKQAEFKLSVGDVVSVTFVDLPDLNVSQRVRPDGTISLPYLGEINVTDMTVQQLSGQLKSRYGKVMKNPNLYVVVPEFRSAIDELKKDLHTAPRGLSRLTTVRPDGYATFAMLGDIMVKDRTIPDVNAELDKKYHDILPGLAVDLFLQEHAGRRIYVLGQVNKPGAYEVSRPTTVVEAIALASGELTSADLGKVVVMRRRGDKMVGRFLDVRQALALNDKGAFFYLQPDDIVYVSRRGLNRRAELSREIADVIFFRGWSLSGSYRLDDKSTD